MLVHEVIPSDEGIDWDSMIVIRSALSHESNLLSDMKNSYKTYSCRIFAKNGGEVCRL